MFKLFDKDNSGYLNKEELSAAMSSIGENMTEQQLDEIINYVDRNGDGKVSLNGKLINNYRSNF